MRPHSPSSSGSSPLLHIVPTPRGAARFDDLGQGSLARMPVSSCASKLPAFRELGRCVSRCGAPEAWHLSSDVCWVRDGKCRPIGGRRAATCASRRLCLPLSVHAHGVRDVYRTGEGVRAQMLAAGAQTSGVVQAANTGLASERAPSVLWVRFVRCVGERRDVGTPYGSLFLPLQLPADAKGRFGQTFTVQWGMMPCAVNCGGEARRGFGDLAGVGRSAPCLHVQQLASWKDQLERLPTFWRYDTTSVGPDLWGEARMEVKHQMPRLCTLQFEVYAAFF